MGYDRILKRIEEIKGRKDSGSYEDLKDNQRYLYDVIKKMSGWNTNVVLESSNIEKKCGPNFDFRNRSNLITDFCYNKVNKEDNKNKFLVSPHRGRFRFVDFDWISNEIIEITWNIRDLKLPFNVGTYERGIFYWDFTLLENYIEKAKGNSSF